MNRAIIVTIVSVGVLLASLGTFWRYDPFHYDLSEKISSATTTAQVQGSADGTSIPPTGAVQISSNANNLSLTELYNETEGSVVQVSGIVNTNSMASEGTLGTGFVYDKSGHIITNYHVIAGGSENDIRVTFIDGTIYRARIVGTDQYSDLAVLHVEGNVPQEKLKPLSLGNSSQLLVGQAVVAIGNPFGLSGSMTEGIVSGLNRLIPVYSGAGQFSDTGSPAFSIPNVIQTDAAINPGNSGGPLLNMQGEVIGMNSAIFSTTGGFAGIGFAIPSNTIAKVAPVLIEKGSFQHPWLGVSGIDMTPEIAEAMGLGEPRGFLVIDVSPGGPADRAGVQGGNTPAQLGGGDIKLGGDVILAINDQPIRKIDDVLGYLEQDTEVGQTVKLTLWRDGQIIGLDATLTARPSLQPSP
ncbi:MAG: trypsin-like peptidase domain-containing protein [Thermoproteota archaeon]|nr:trypsin-like peptidase domain-containing protein [Thermoproteota archaeon]